MYFRISLCFGCFSVVGGSAEPAAGGSDQGGGNGEEASGKAPVVPFGLDLYYWGEEQPTAGKIIKYSNIHKKHPSMCVYGRNILGVFVCQVKWPLESTIACVFK